MSKPTDNSTLRRALDRFKLQPATLATHLKTGEKSLGYVQDFAKFVARRNHASALHRPQIQRRPDAAIFRQLISNQVLRRYIWPVAEGDYSLSSRIYRMRPRPPQQDAPRPDRSHFNFQAGPEYNQSDFFQHEPAWEDNFNLEEFALPETLESPLQAESVPLPRAESGSTRLASSQPVAPASALTEFRPPVLRSLLASEDFPVAPVPDPTWNPLPLLHLHQPAAPELPRFGLETTWNSPSALQRSNSTQAVTLPGAKTTLPSETNPLRRAINRAEGPAILPGQGEPQASPVIEQPLNALARVLQRSEPAQASFEESVAATGQFVRNPEGQFRTNAEEQVRVNSFSSPPVIFRQTDKTTPPEDYRFASRSGESLPSTPAQSEAIPSSRLGYASELLGSQPDAPALSQDVPSPISRSGTDFPVALPSSPVSSSQPPLPSPLLPDTFVAAPEAVLARFAAGSLIARSYQTTQEPSFETPQAEMTPGFVPTATTLNSSGVFQSQALELSPLASVPTSPTLNSSGFFQPAIGNPAIEKWAGGLPVLRSSNPAIGGWAGRLPVLQSNPGLAQFLPEPAVGWMAGQTELPTATRIFAMRENASSKEQADELRRSPSGATLPATTQAHLPPVSFTVPPQIPGETTLPGITPTAYQPVAESRTEATKVNRTPGAEFSSELTESERLSAPYEAPYNAIQAGQATLTQAEWFSAPSRPLVSQFSPIVTRQTIESARPFYPVSWIQRDTPDWGGAVSRMPGEAREAGNLPAFYAEVEADFAQPAWDAPVMLYRESRENKPEAETTWQPARSNLANRPDMPASYDGTRSGSFTTHNLENQPDITASVPLNRAAEAVTTPAQTGMPVALARALERLEGSPTPTVLMRALAEAGLDFGSQAGAAVIPELSMEMIASGRPGSYSRSYTSPPLIWRKASGYAPPQSAPIEQSFGVEAAEPAPLARSYRAPEGQNQPASDLGLERPDLNDWVAQLPALQSNPGLIPLTERDATAFTQIYANLPKFEPAGTPGESAASASSPVQRLPVRQSDYPQVLEAATEARPVPRILASMPKADTEPVPKLNSSPETSRRPAEQRTDLAHQSVEQRTELANRPAETGEADGEEGAWQAEPASPLVSRFTPSADQPVSPTQMLHPNTWVQRKAKEGDATPTPASPIGLPHLDTVLRTAVGRPLTPNIQTQMGQIFRTSFEHVRVHHDEQAANYTQAMGAEAFTAGHHIFFAPGRYQPETPTGQALLGHELTHVVQQANLPSLGQGRMPEVSEEGQTLERQAIQNERAIFRHLENNQSKAAPEIYSGNASSVQRSFNSAEALRLPLEQAIGSGNNSSSNFSSNGHGPNSSVQRTFESNFSSGSAPIQRVETGEASSQEADLDAIAERVLRMLKRQLITERERHGARGGQLM